VARHGARTDPLARPRTVDQGGRQGSVDRRSIDAQARFDLDVRELGLVPPRIFSVVVGDVVTVQVTLFALATAK